MCLPRGLISCVANVWTSANVPPPLPPPADPAGRCAAVLFFRHQLAVLPAVDSELLALGIAGTEEELLGLPGAEAAADAAARAPASATGSSGPSAGAAQGGTAGAAAGGAATAGPAAEGAAAVGNSYVDNLGKAGIKEVRSSHEHQPCPCAQRQLLCLFTRCLGWRGSLLSLSYDGGP